MDVSWDLTDGTKITYEYEFLPKSVIPRFIVRTHELIKRDEKGNYLCWRNGAILEKVSDGVTTMAYIKADPIAKKIEITIGGDNRREFIGLIRGHFDYIHEKTKEIKPELKIPCNCEKGCTGTHDYAYLLRCEKEGKTETECKKSAKMVPVKRLFEHVIISDKYTVFICHSSKDTEFIKNNILPDFKSNSISYWIDHEQIQPGDPIIKKIEEGLQNSKNILVCISEHLHGSDWCRAEYEAILHEIFAGATKQKVIPFKLDNCDKNNVPLMIRNLKRTEYLNKDSYNNLLSLLSKP
jgi:hypothetical protein